MRAHTTAAETLAQAFERLVEALRADERLDAGAHLVAIANGGNTLAEWLQRALAFEGAPGQINASFHRDDIGLKPIPKHFQPTQLDFSLDGAQVILVDDVFSTGRTARAALNELFDYGRPELVRLAVLADTGQRRLPLQPDCVGMVYPVEADQLLKIRLHPDDASAHSLEVTPA